MFRRSPGLLGLGMLSLWLLFATPLPAQDVPAPLRDWQGWVLHDVPRHGCPFIANQMPGEGSYQCAWPGRLALDATKAQKELGWRPTVDLSDGIERTIEWLRAALVPELAALVGA